MTAFYNEIDPYAAQWIRNLIAAGHVAPGVVDERSIEDIKPEELHEFTQCHFFAGIAVWSLALRSAGWADDQPVWTGSCPCQPFSAAGQGAGFADERHLWPAFHHLIAECRPPIVLGEQVASKDADPWVDLVQDDMEGVGYRFGAVPFPSAGVGAPHIRDRLYWVADAVRARPLPGAHVRVHRGEEGAGPRNGEPQRPGAACGLADTDSGAGGQGCADVRGRIDGSDAQSRPGSSRSVVPVGLANTFGAGSSIERGHRRQSEGRAQGRSSGGLADAILLERSGRQPGLSDEHAAGGRIEGAAAPAGLRSDLPAGPTNGYWRDADWLGCRDGKLRPVEPGTFPLAHGAAARVGRLRAYGNAINAEAARVFIEAVMECRP